MLTDLLLPRTDAGVLAQGAAVGAALTIAAIAVRRSPDLRWLVAGLAVMALGLFGLRALHRSRPPSPRPSRSLHAATATPTSSRSTDHRPDVHQDRCTSEGRVACCDGFPPA